VIDLSTLMHYVNSFQTSDKKIGKERYESSYSCVSNIQIHLCISNTHTHTHKYIYGYPRDCFVIVVASRQLLTTPPTPPFFVLPFIRGAPYFQYTRGWRPLYKKEEEGECDYKNRPLFCCLMPLIVHIYIEMLERDVCVCVHEHSRRVTWWYSHPRPAKSQEEDLPL
jgi:hypothetical protein